MNGSPNPARVPRRSGPPRSLARRTFAPVLAGLGFLVVLFGGLWVIAMWMSDDADVDLRVGADTFDFDAEDAARRVAKDGPLLYQDLLVGGERDIWVSHVGTDPERGWFAFLARVPGSDRECTVVWDRVEEQFVDPCTDETYPATGEGLPQLPTGVDIGGDVVVDLTPEGEPGRGTTTLPS